MTPTEPRNGPADRPPGADDEGGATDQARRADLEARIEAARAAQRPTPGPNMARKYNALTLAWRMTLELVVGTAIGFLAGWGLDELFGTSPAFLLILGLLGVAAGFKVAIETAQSVSRGDAKAGRAEDEDGSEPGGPGRGAG
ncbi:MAG: AtpZ/AtpI family protein [Pseudomonadota bacterium]